MTTAQPESQTQKTPPKIALSQFLRVCSWRGPVRWAAFNFHFVSRRIFSAVIDEVQLAFRAGISTKEPHMEAQAKPLHVLARDITELTHAFLKYGCYRTGSEENENFSWYGAYVQLLEKVYQHTSPVGKFDGRTCQRFIEPFNVTVTEAIAGIAADGQVGLLWRTIACHNRIGDFLPKLAGGLDKGINKWRKSMNSWRPFKARKASLKMAYLTTGLYEQRNRISDGPDKKMLEIALQIIRQKLEPEDRARIYKTISSDELKASFYDALTAPLTPSCAANFRDILAKKPTASMEEPPPNSRGVAQPAAPTAGRTPSGTHPTEPPPPAP